MSVLEETWTHRVKTPLSRVYIVQLRSMVTNSESIQLHFWKQMILDRRHAEVETKAAESFSPSERTGSNAGGRTAINTALFARHGHTTVSTKDRG